MMTRTAASRRPDLSPHPPRRAPSPSASGPRHRVPAVERPPGEDFQEPEPDLATRTSSAPHNTADQLELRKARALLSQRAEEIRSLKAHIASIEQNLGTALATLRARESQLEELRELFLPVPKHAPEPQRVAPAHPAPPKRATLTLLDSPLETFDCLEFVDHVQLFSGISLDTITGVFIPTYRTAKVGSHAEFEIELADATTVRANGVVSWIREAPSADAERPGLGIDFSNPSRATRVAFEELCRTRPPIYMEL